MDKDDMFTETHRDDTQSPDVATLGGQRGLGNVVEDGQLSHDPPSTLLLARSQIEIPSDERDVNLYYGEEKEPESKEEPRIQVQEDRWGHEETKEQGKERRGPRLMSKDLEMGGDSSGEDDENSGRSAVIRKIEHDKEGDRGLLEYSRHRMKEVKMRMSEVKEKRCMDKGEEDLLKFISSKETVMEDEREIAEETLVPDWLMEQQEKATKEEVDRDEMWAIMKGKHQWVRTLPENKRCRDCGVVMKRGAVPFYMRSCPKCYYKEKKMVEAEQKKTVEAEQRKIVETEHRRAVEGVQGKAVKYQTTMWEPWSMRTRELMRRADLEHLMGLGEVRRVKKQMERISGRVLYDTARFDNQGCAAETNTMS